VTREKLQIRRLEPGDQEFVLEMREAGSREIGALIEEPGFYDDLLDIEGEYLDGCREFLVGVCQRSIAAMGASQGRAEVKRMRVATGFRRRGFVGQVPSVFYERDILA